ncbi:immunoglobulin-binding protein 1b-like isoform X1 [Nannospalax galili]|uniref:immunoglobulin-binding protein 1b-like isoform X1 n=1 Tax=Nannospalax galili TaxID=1026970 RepID=UPI0004ED0758|nr:immunoglobulin-binding protein 1b-like isoform X1 [Nannospalax galili]
MAAFEDLQELRLPELLESSRQLLEEVEETTEPTGSKIIQDKVRRGLDLLLRASGMLSQLDLFSPNEDWEEIASADLKYLMLPALQGALTLKLLGAGQRLDHLQQAREHFLTFLTQMHNYHVADFELPWAGSSSPEEGQAATSSPAERSLVAMASQRQTKIQRYKRKKEVEERLSGLQSAVESGQADDQLVREYHLLHLRRWVSISLDEIDSIDQEIKILRERDSFSEVSASYPRPQEKPPLKPFVLTRSTAQAQVFGAGYPSLATMTVNEWYEQRQKCKALPAPEVETQPTRVGSYRESQQEEEEEQEKEEHDEARQRLQQWDDWKESHPRGYGNRQNMG